MNSLPELGRRSTLKSALAVARGTPEANICCPSPGKDQDRRYSGPVRPSKIQSNGGITWNTVTPVSFKGRNPSLHPVVGTATGGS